MRWQNTIFRSRHMFFDYTPRFGRKGHFSIAPTIARGVLRKKALPFAPRICSAVKGYFLQLQYTHFSHSLLWRSRPGMYRCSHEHLCDVTCALSRLVFASLREVCQQHPKNMHRGLGPRSRVIGESSARGARAKILVYIYIYIYI